MPIVADGLPYEDAPYTNCITLVDSYNLTWKFPVPLVEYDPKLDHSKVNTLLGDVPEV